MKPGQEFAASDWPLHVTIVGVFALDWNDEYFSEFASLVAGHHTFSSNTTSIEHFGPKREVKVRLVEPNKSLNVLHRDIATFILDRGGAFNDLRYQLDGFRPHVTMRGDEPSENYEITFDQLALIDLFPGSDYTRRKIIKLSPLATS